LVDKTYLRRRTSRWSKQRLLNTVLHLVLLILNTVEINVAI
jgi:hypothetical protein